MGVLCTWVKLLTDLQISGRELHKNAFGGRAPPRPAEGAIALPQIPPGGGEGVIGKEKVGNREGRKRREGKDQGYICRGLGGWGG